MEGLPVGVIEQLNPLGVREHVYMFKHTHNTLSFTLIFQPPRVHIPSQIIIRHYYETLLASTGRTLDAFQLLHSHTN